MSTHWKKLTNPDYLGSYALDPDKDLIVTIKSVSNEVVKGPDGKEEECIVARFIDGTKPMILNATNCKTISQVYGTPYIEDWCGKSIQIYIAQVKAFGEVVDALRIRKKKPTVDKPALTTESKKLDSIIQKIRTGETTMETVRNYFTVSTEMEQYILSEAAHA